MTSPSPAPLRILLVDDEPLIRDSICAALAFYGHSVEIAASGVEALALFRSSSFDLVITDYGMPGMKGDELAATLKAILPMQPVLMISADVKRLRSLGDALPAVDAIIAKPFQLEELRQAIAKLVMKTPRTPSGGTGQDGTQP